MHIIAKPEAIETKGTSINPISISSSRRNSADDAARLEKPHNEDQNPKDDFDIYPSTISNLYTKVRSISYQNESDGVSSVSEWIRIHTQHEARRIKVLTTKKNLEASTPLLKESFWEAHYFASDDDFLMDSKIRAYFKENALENADAMLFSLTSSGDSQRYQNGIQHPALGNYVFYYQDSSGNVYSITPRKLRVILFVTLLVGMMLVRLFAPPRLLLLGLLLLLLGFCLLLLLLV